MWKSKFYGAFEPNHRVVLHAKPLLDGVAMPVPHRSIEPGRPRERNASCAWDGCADQIFLTKSDVEHLRNGTSLSMNEAWRSAGAALGAQRGAHSSLRRFFLDGARKARTSHIT